MLPDLRSLSLGRDAFAAGPPRRPSDVGAPGDPDSRKRARAVYGPPDVVSMKFHGYTALANFLASSFESAPGAESDRILGALVGIVIDRRRWGFERGQRAAPKEVFGHDFAILPDRRDGKLRWLVCDRGVPCAPLHHSLKHVTVIVKGLEECGPGRRVTTTIDIFLRPEGSDPEVYALGAAAEARLRVLLRDPAVSREPGDARLVQRQQGTSPTCWFVTTVFFIGLFPALVEAPEDATEQQRETAAGVAAMVHAVQTAPTYEAFLNNCTRETHYARKILNFAGLDRVAELYTRNYERSDGIYGAGPGLLLNLDDGGHAEHLVRALVEATGNGTPRECPPPSNWSVLRKRYEAAKAGFDAWDWFFDEVWESEYEYPVMRAALAASLRSHGCDWLAENVELSEATEPWAVDLLSSNDFEGFKRMIRVPNNATSLPEETLSDCECIPIYKLPPTLQSIGRAALSGNGKLFLKALPESLVTIGACAFADCSTLKELELPTNLRSIGEYAFAGCSRLRVTLNVGIVEIAAGAFAECAGARVPDEATSLISVGEGALSSAEEQERAEAIVVRNKAAAQLGTTTAAA